MLDHISQKWEACAPLIPGSIPRPDYCAGYQASAFSASQRRKLEPFIKNWKTTPFLATPQMYFPYLTASVVDGNSRLTITDPENAYSCAVAVMQVVELYRRVGRQRELEGEVLAFSVSHNHEAVRIYAYYPIIDGDLTSIHRYEIKKFDITNEDGRERWTVYRFTRNVYDIYGPIHLERLGSTVDQLPNLQSNQRQLQELNLTLLPQTKEVESQSDSVHSQELSSQTSPPSFKRPRRNQS
ncbi:reverse transcriptase protein [Rutstroemia sp. NJR-2017a WRK4]|nr:reverse transcriptase protein [Rutstroemia sp. NJR-2017a WRK4]